MVAGVLNTPRVIEVSIFIVRAFIRLRKVAIHHKDLQMKIAEIENHLTDQDEQNYRTHANAKTTGNA
jgi:hypothetical protein